jgi:predicted metal-dependent hydrolase
MKIYINNNFYNVIVERKNNKNTYLRVKEDLSLYITTNYFMTDKNIEKFILNNEKQVIKMIELVKRRIEKNDSYFLLGKKYNIVYCLTFKEPVIDENRIFVKNKNALDKFTRNYASLIFNERLKVCYNLFEERIVFPKLIIKKMKRKWGYNKKSDDLIALNLDLIKYNINEIDYVIIHELCHFVYFNHSKEFWKLVSKYKKDYKSCKEVLNDNN